MLGFGELYPSFHLLHQCFLGTGFASEDYGFMSKATAGVYDSPPVTTGGVLSLLKYNTWQRMNKRRYKEDNTYCGV